MPDEDKPLFFNPDIFQEVRHHSTFDVFCSVFKKENRPETPEDYINESMYFEIKTFLHGLLVVENKMSMAHSLETRVPFLDNDMVDFVTRIPPQYNLSSLKKINRMDEDDVRKMIGYFNRTSGGKLILRKAMQKLIPRNITQRAKQGFSAPDASWFKGESIDYIHDLLGNKKARLYQYLNHQYVDSKLKEHISGRVNHRLFIWSLLSFEWWLRSFIT
jgi:asparagine synthase (glutamine-hydrolysing)